MQSDPPQGDPRLQRVDPRHASVAVRCPQPCIVYLETTLPGELPLLGICWANDSREVREPGQPACVELKGVTVIQNQPTRRKLWKFSMEYSPSCFLFYGDSPNQPCRLSYVQAGFEQAAPLVFAWAVRPLDHETHMSLRRVRTDFPNDPNVLTAAILRLANLDWPSIHDALVAIGPRDFQKARVPGRRRRTFIGRLLSSVFRKKQQTVHA